jgi:hypothetical protein
MGEEQVPAFRDLTRLVKWLKIALGILAVATLLTAFSDWQQINALERAQPAGAASGDLREALVELLYVIADLATAILFLRWTYLARKNAAALGATGFRVSPGWSVGFYFIPILCLWKPYQALKETFQASNPEVHGDWKSSPRPRLLPLWWTLWIVSCCAAEVSFQASMQANTADDNASRLDLISSLIDLPLIGVVWVLVSTLQAWQTSKALAGGDKGGSAPKPAVDLIPPPDNPAPVS